MALTKSEIIGRNFLELVDSIRAVRNNSVGEDVLPITFPQLKLLRILAQNPGGVRQKELAAELKLTPGTVSVAINLLVNHKLLKRVPDQNDRRAVMIRMTPKGRRCLELHINFWNTVMGELLQKIPATEQDIFITVFEQINAGLRKFAAPEPEMNPDC